jgi:hypothetical protein
VNRTQSAVACGQLVQPLAGLVRAPVVHQEHLERTLERLQRPADPREQRVDVAGLIVQRRHH